MKMTELIDTLAGGDVLKWIEVTSLSVNGFLFRWNYLNQKAKKQAHQNM